MKLVILVILGLVAIVMGTLVIIQAWYEPDIEESMYEDGEYLD